MNWDQQALELWLEESARKDEDAMTLAKYAREDEGKIKELTLRLGRLTDEAADRKKKLNNEMMDTQTTQVGCVRCWCFRTDYYLRPYVQFYFFIIIISLGWVYLVLV